MFWELKKSFTICCGCVWLSIIPIQGTFAEVHIEELGKFDEYIAEIKEMQELQKFRVLLAANQSHENEHDNEHSQYSNGTGSLDSQKIPHGRLVDSRFPGAESPAKPKDLIDRTGGMPMDVPEVSDLGQTPDRGTLDNQETSRGTSINSRFPGAESPTKPKDLIDRTGGMPMDVPEGFDLGKNPREVGILRRQQLLNRFNPAIGVVFETVLGYTQRRQRFVRGDGPDASGEVGTRLPSGFSSVLRTIELFASADVDPFTRAYLIASGHAEGVDSRGSEEFGKAIFEIEEAAIQTTALPFNLSVRGGRFFADWGYLGRRHAHDLPQIDIPPSLALITGNGNRTDGLELSWLAPTDLYLAFLVGYGFNFGFAGEGPLSNFRTQPIQGNTVYGSARTYYDLTDDHNVELGFSALYTPQSRVAEAEEAGLLAVDENDPIDRHTFNVDFHYRWYPLGRGLRQSLSIHGEVLYDYGQGRRNAIGQTKAQGTWGGYVYTEYRFNKQWRPGFRFDYYQLPSEPALVTNSITGNPGSTVNRNGKRTAAMTFSPYITFYPSEFQRFVIQYNHSRVGNTVAPQNQVLFQWQVVIGSHQHGFTERN